MNQISKAFLGLAAFASLAGSASSFADISSVSPNVCDRSLADFQAVAADWSSRIAFSNTGGAFNGGVCWWHSRLQRSAVYLTMFRPDLPKPSRAEGNSIVDSLVSMNRVIVIPGYRNFNEFSRDYESKINSRLESWQREDGILRFRWVTGLTGSTTTSPSNMHYIMTRIHDMVAVQHRIPFEKLQLPGVLTHAYLIISSRQTSYGYSIGVIDSNSPGETVQVEYHNGDTFLRRPYTGSNFVPYLTYEGDIGKIYGALNYYCKRPRTE